MAESLNYTITRIFAAVLSCALVLVANPVLAERGSPRLEIAAPVFDFGSVAQGAVVEHQFEIQNKGEATLKIRKIHPSCGCTAAVLESDSVAPGESTSVKTTFDTAGFDGQKMKTIRVYTNDPERSSVVLRIQGYVKADVIRDPISVNFESVLHGVKHSKDVVVSVEQGSPTKILDARSRSPQLDLDIDDYEEGGRKGIKISVTLKETAPIGSFTGRVVVRTTSKRNPVVTIPVMAHVEGDLLLSSRVVSFGLLKGPLSQGVQQTLTLKNRGSNPIQIRSVVSDSPLVDVVFSTLEEGRKYEIKVKVKKNATGIVRARVTIKTDHQDSEQRVLVLPVYAMISRGDAEKGR